jgi:LEA14-like dessication related protein
MGFKNILNSKIFLVFATLFCVVFLIAQTVSYPDIKTINSFKIHSFDDDIFKVSMNLEIHNNNWFTIRGKQISFKIAYNNRIIAKGSSIEDIKFYRKTRTDLPIQIDFYPDSMQSDLRDILLKDSIQINIDLDAKFSIFKMSSHKNIKTWIKTDDLVNTLIAQSMKGDGLKLKSVELVKTDIQETVLNVCFDFKNTLNLPLELKTMRYSIYADDAHQNKVADWNVKLNKVIQPNKFETINSEVIVDNITSALTGFTKILNGKSDYFIGGYAFIAIKGREIKIPIKQHFLVDFLAQKITILKTYE